MRKIMGVVAIGVLLTVMGASAALAGHGEKRAVKKAILVVAFGTSVPEAQAVYQKIDAKVRQAFPKEEVRWAYTSKIIRAKLAKQGKPIDSPEVALAKLMGEEYTHVAILSLHTIPGAEFHDLYQNAHLYGQMTDGFERVMVAWPLLSTHEDMVKVAQGIIKNLPADRKPEDAVLLMGHGSGHHPADAIYAAMNQVFQGMDSNIFVATVEGYPSLDDVLAQLDKKKGRKVYLVPMMLVAGDHAMNDMAGDEPDSWKSVLSGKGFDVVTVLKGTGDYPAVVDVWIDHLRAAFAHL